MAKKKPTPKSSPLATLPTGYAALLDDLKVRIRSAQLSAARAVHHELVTLYWRIGREILTRQHSEGWGAKVIDRLGRDLQTEFPGVAGFSPRNLKYMRAFATAWTDGAIVQQVAAQIPWFHHCLLLDRIKNPVARIWYVRMAVAPALRDSRKRSHALLQRQTHLAVESGWNTPNVFPSGSMK